MPEKQFHELVPVHPKERELAQSFAQNVPVLRQPLKAIALTGKEPIFVYSHGEIIRAQFRNFGDKQNPYPSVNVKYPDIGSGVVCLSPNAVWDTDKEALQERIVQMDQAQEAQKSSGIIMPYPFDAEIITLKTDIFATLDTVSNAYGGLEMDDIANTARHLLGRVSTALGVIGLEKAKNCVDANIIDKYVYEVLKEEIEELYAFLKSTLHVVISSDISLPMTQTLKQVLLQAALEHIDAFLKKHSVTIQHTQFLVAHSKGLTGIMERLKANMHTRTIFPK